MIPALPVSRRASRIGTLTRLLDEALMARGTEAWLVHFAGSVPAAPVYDVERALTSDFVTQEDRVWVYPHPERPGFPHGTASVPFPR